jgi:phospholipid/cholesterol/gamma-HCH transport system ATP-binding protein
MVNNPNNRMTSSAPILQFDRVAIESHALYESALCDVSFALGPGDLMLVLLDAEHLLLPLADAAQGLVPPLQGRITFRGEDWQTLPADRAARHRGHIGRIFPEAGWVSNLDIDENITLAQRHHTRRPVPAITDEAATLSRQFGLPGLPLGKIVQLRRQDLQKAACVRALLGEPVLIIAEDPTRHVYADIIAPLVNMLFAARQRGAAVLWVTSNPKVWNDAGLKPTARGKMTGSQLHLMESAA